MGGLGVVLALVGGVMALVSGLSRGDAAEAGLGVALAGIGILVWELLIAIGPKPVETLDQQP
jgi:hypothetical protein